MTGEITGSVGGGQSLDILWQQEFRTGLVRVTWAATSGYGCIPDTSKAVIQPSVIANDGLGRREGNLPGLTVTVVGPKERDLAKQLALREGRDIGYGNFIMLGFREWDMSMVASLPVTKDDSNSLTKHLLAGIKARGSAEIKQAVDLERDFVDNAPGLLSTAIGIIAARGYARYLQTYPLGNGQVTQARTEWYGSMIAQEMRSVLQPEDI